MRSHCIDSANANAKAWNLPPGTHTPSGYWNQEATTLAAKYHLNEPFLAQYDAPADARLGSKLSQ